MLTCKPVVINIIKDINIMNQHGCVIIKQRCRLLQTPTRLQQSVRFVTETNQRGVVLLCNVVTSGA